MIFDKTIVIVSWFARGIFFFAFAYQNAHPACDLGKAAHLKNLSNSENGG